MRTYYSVCIGDQCAFHQAACPLSSPTVSWHFLQQQMCWLRCWLARRCSDDSPVCCAQACFVRLFVSNLFVQDACVPCRGRGRSHDSLRGSSHPHGGFQGSSQHPGEGQEVSHPQLNSEVTLGGPEQSPLGRSPSNRTYSSANHLLNFQSYSNDYHGRGGRGSNEGRGRGGHRRAAAKPMPYNRNKFLQANFRFLVSDAGNLKKHEADADLMLDWDDVVQV